MLYVTRNQVPNTLLKNYPGNKITVSAIETVTVPTTAGLWDGGSRDIYKAVYIEDGKELEISDSYHAPWDSARHEHTITMNPLIAVLRITEGPREYLHIYVHPETLVKLLPSKPALTDNERIVLKSTKTYKSHYNGKDRYTMAKEQSYSFQLTSATFPTREQWELAKQSLINKGLLNRAGAITVDGRNAIF